MRYIGSKIRLLNNLESVFDKCSDSESICDLFSGTASVARHFKKKYSVISNDVLYFSYVLQKATIENDSIPDFSNIKKVMNITDVFEYLNNLPIENFKENGFFYNNFSPNGGRMYVTDINALRIDATRITIDDWFKNNLITEMEFFYLLACLIEGIPYISNISGTYGAYHKTWDKRALNDFKLFKLDVYTNNKNNYSFNMNGENLLEEISGDILYLDPPYNSRQYLPNYHLLETAAKYDNPTLKGVTGVRHYEDEKSDFCLKGKVYEALYNIVKKAKFKYIILSYNSEGLLSEQQIESIFKEFGNPETYELEKIPFTRFKSRENNHRGEIFEYIFYIEKLNEKKN